MSELKLSEILNLCNKNCAIILKYYNCKIKTKLCKPNGETIDRIGKYIIECKLVKDWIESIDKNELHDCFVTKIIPSKKKILYIETERLTEDILKNISNHPPCASNDIDLGEINTAFKQYMEKSFKELQEKLLKELN